MSKTIKLPSGKLIDLSRFVAMLPADNKYKLSLDGANTTIEVDTEDAQYINRQLQLVSDNNNSHVKEQWDKANQLRKNQPLMQLIKQWREQKNGQPATEEEIQSYREIQEALKNQNVSWDREEQIRLNQPKLRKLKEIIERKKQEQPSAEKAAYFESFKKTMDAHRPVGRKLYEH